MIQYQFEFQDEESSNKFLASLIGAGIVSVAGTRIVLSGAKVSTKRKKHANAEKDIQNQNSVLSSSVAGLGVVLGSTKDIIYPSITDHLKKQPSPTSQIREAWLAAYSRRYPLAKRYPWGAREGGQCNNLLRSLPLEEVLELIPRYFEWPNPQVIRATHPFGHGAHCFVMKYLELRGDLSHPERHAEAAEAEAQMRDATQEVSRASIVEAALRDHERKTKKLES